jgi:ABC-type Zn2+ transport system substrate-binding protein/surface adhesin
VFAELARDLKRHNQAMHRMVTLQEAAGVGAPDATSEQEEEHEHEHEHENEHEHTHEHEHKSAPALSLPPPPPTAEPSFLSRLWTSQVGCTVCVLDDSASCWMIPLRVA